MSQGESITRWVKSLQQHDSSAARKLWQSFGKRIEAIARRELGRFPVSPLFDEEDVALSAFTTFCQQIQAGKFTELGDRHELWWLLMVITKRKAGERVKHERAVRRRSPVIGQETTSELEDVPAGGPTPEEWVVMREQCDQLLQILGDDELRFITIWKLEGRTNEEIAKKLMRTRQTVQRKLNLIRSIWREELEE